MPAGLIIATIFVVVVLLRWAYQELSPALTVNTALLLPYGLIAIVCFVFAILLYVGCKSMADSLHEELDRRRMDAEANKARDELTKAFDSAVAEMDELTKRYSQ